MKIHDALMGGAFIALAVAILFEISAFPTLPGQPYGPATFPMIVAIAMLAGGTVLVGSGLMKSRRGGLVRVEAWLKTPGALVNMACVPLFAAVYVLLADSVGFPILVPVLLTIFLLLTTRRAIVSLVTAFAVTAIVWVLFANFLLVPLPLGLLTEVIY